MNEEVDTSAPSLKMYLKFLKLDKTVCLDHEFKVGLFVALELMKHFICQSKSV